MPSSQSDIGTIFSRRCVNRVSAETRKADLFEVRLYDRLWKVRFYDPTID